MKDIVNVIAKVLLVVVFLSAALSGEDGKISIQYKVVVQKCTDRYGNPISQEVALERLAHRVSALREKGYIFYGVNEGGIVNGRPWGYWAWMLKVPAHGVH